MDNYKKWATVLSILSTLLILVMFIFTDPRQVGLLGILIVILAIYVLFASCIYLVLRVFRKNKRENNDRRQILISSVLAFAPILLIIFNSLGTIGIVEVVAILLFETVTVFLITKRT